MAGSSGVDAVNVGSSLVLASASPARAAMLYSAGVVFAVDAAAVDETRMKTALRADGADAVRTAEALAELKAKQVSERHRDALVIGADQVLDCADTWFDKPADRAAARRDLLALRAKMHMQVSAACVVRDGAVLWRHSARARLAMRQPVVDQVLEEAPAELARQQDAGVPGNVLSSHGAPVEDVASRPIPSDASRATTSPPWVDVFTLLSMSRSTPSPSM